MCSQGYGCNALLPAGVSKKLRPQTPGCHENLDPRKTQTPWMHACLKNSDPEKDVDSLTGKKC